MCTCVCIFKCAIQRENNYFNELPWEKHFSIVFLLPLEAHLILMRLQSGICKRLLIIYKAGCLVYIYSCAAQSESIESLLPFVQLPT